jgi:hypothetical protein
MIGRVCDLYIFNLLRRVGLEILGGRDETIYKCPFTSLSIKLCVYIVLYKYIIEANKYIQLLFSAHRVVAYFALGQIYLVGRLIKVLKLTIIIKHRVKVGP